MILRKWEKSDTPSVMAIENASFSDPWSETAFNGLFKSRIYKNFVVEENGEILGYMSVIATIYMFEIINIAVKENARKRGIGSMLIAQAKEIAKETGATEIFLEVRLSNLPAINLYKKSGFIENGIRRGYYEDGESALLMSCQI